METQLEPQLLTQAAVAESICCNCGVRAPTRDITLHQNIGILVMRFTAKMSGPMCKRCIKAYFISYTTTTLLLGWWGMISFFVTPFILIGNLYQFATSLRLASPDSGMMASLPGDAKPIVSGNSDFNFKAKLIWGAIVWLALLGYIAYHNVKLVENYSPSLNATLHSGEISDDEDGTYAGQKIAQDVQILSADYKTKTWAGMRTEFLAKKPYLTDLETQNAKAQRLAVKEHALSPEQLDTCERLALDSYVPALNDYTNAMRDFFQFLEATPTPTRADVARLQPVSDKMERANDKINKYKSDRDRKGCK